MVSGLVPPPGQHACREPTVPNAAREQGHWPPALRELSSREGAWAAGKVADLMMSSADLLWRATAAVSRVGNQWTELLVWSSKLCPRVCGIEKF